MAYNHAQAFKDSPAICESCIRNIAATAIIHYRYEFPNVEAIEVRFYQESRHVECFGGDEPRLYSFKELGFGDVC